MSVSLSGSASRGGLFVIASQALKIAVHFASIILLARLLPPEAFGLMAMALAIVGLADILRDVGLAAAAVQAKDLSHAQGSNLFWLSTGMGALLALLVAAFAFPISYAYSDERLVGIVWAIAPVYFFNGVATQFRAQMMRSMKFWAIAVSDCVPLVAGLSLAVALAAAGWGYWSLVAQQLTIGVVAMTLCIALSGWRPGGFRRGAGTLRFLRFGINVTGTQVLGYAGRNADVMLVGLVAGPAVAGAYNRASQLVMAPINQISIPLTKVALPVLSRAFQRGGDKEYYLRRAQLVACYGIALLFAFAFGQADNLIAIVLGTGWQGAVVFFQALCAAGAFRALSQVSYWGYLAAGLPGRQLAVYAVSQPVMIACMALAALNGPVTLAWTVTITSFAYWFVAVVMMTRNLGIRSLPILLGAALPLSVLGGPIALGSYAIGTVVTGPWLSLVLAGIGSVAWMAVVATLLPPVRRDILFLWRFACRAFDRR